MSSAEEDPGDQYVLYRMFDINDHLLYVGRTMNVAGRINVHRRRKSWWQHIVTIKLEHFPDRRSLVAAEAVAVATERPQHNLKLINGERRTHSVRNDQSGRQEVEAVTVKWVEPPAHKKWHRCANALRERPGVEGVLDVISANPSVDAYRINHGVLAAFRPRGHFHARVVGGQIWAKYEPQEPVTLGADQPLGDDDR